MGACTPRDRIRCAPGAAIRGQAADGVADGGASREWIEAAVAALQNCKEAELELSPAQLRKLVVATPSVLGYNIEVSAHA